MNRTSETYIGTPSGVYLWSESEGTVVRISQAELDGSWPRIPAMGGMGRPPLTEARIREIIREENRAARQSSWDKWYAQNIPYLPTPYKEPYHRPNTKSGHITDGPHGCMPECRPFERSTLYHDG